jgi:hypothetical protein
MSEADHLADLRAAQLGAEYAEAAKKEVELRSKLAEAQKKTKAAHRRWKQALAGLHIPQSEEVDTSEGNTRRGRPVRLKPEDVKVLRQLDGILEDDIDFDRAHRTYFGRDADENKRPTYSRVRNLRVRGMQHGFMTIDNAGLMEVDWEQIEKFK